MSTEPVACSLDGVRPQLAVRAPAGAMPMVAEIFSRGR